MGVAMPPKLIEAVAGMLEGDKFSALNLYYMHGSQTLSESLLKPELADAKKGSISRIVPRLEGGAVTDTRMDT